MPSRLGVVAVALMASIAAALVPMLTPSPAQADPALATPMVTVTLSRTEISAADQAVGGERGACVRDDKDVAPLDTQVLPWVAANTPSVHLTGSVETDVTQKSAEWCAHYGETRAPSWTELQRFQSLYGMRFISHSANYPTSWSSVPLSWQNRFDDFSPSALSDWQRWETCGSRDALYGHGLLGGDGQFNWPDNKLDAGVQAADVEPCFYFNRIYQGNGVNTLASAQANNNELSSKQISGGSCNVPGLACSTVLPYRYVVPRQIMTQISNLKPGQEYSLQTYLLVRNTNPVYQTNQDQWDCTNPNPAYHWSNDVERYCWSDFKRVLTFLQNDPNIVVTDPEGVAVAWGMSPPSQ